MIRKCFWSAFGLALVVVAGCGQEPTDNTSVNSENIPQTQYTGPPKGQGGGGGGDGGGGGGAQAKGGGPMAGGDASSSYPSDYPGMKKPGGAAEAGKDGEKKDGEKKEGEKKEGETKEAPKTASVNFTPEELAAIKELPEADQKLAMAQGICLVSEEEGKPAHLGVMGKPFKTEVNGKTVFLCCKSCEPELKKDPAKYLAKLPK